MVEWLNGKFALQIIFYVDINCSNIEINSQKSLDYEFVPVNFKIDLVLGCPSRRGQVCSFRQKHLYIRKTKYNEVRTE